MVTSRLVVAEPVADVPHRHGLVGAADNAASHMQNLLKRARGDAEGDHCITVVVDHGGDIRPRLIDGAVDRPLHIDRAVALVDGVVVERKFHQVGAADDFRAARAGQKIALWIIRMPDADMAKSVDHIFPRQNAVGHGQIPECLVEVGHWCCLFR